MMSTTQLPTRGTAGLAGYLSPCVRRLVDVNDVHVQSISGTGRDGRVSKADVLAHLASRTASDARPAAGAGGARADRQAVRANTAFMSVEVDLTDASERAPAEWLAVVAVAVGRVLPMDPRPSEGLPQQWWNSLSVRWQDPESTILIRDHRLLSAAGLARIIRREGPAGEGVDDGDAEGVGARLVLQLTSHPALTVEGLALRPGEAAGIVLGGATRRPVAIGTASGEVLAVRSLAQLTLSYDVTHVRAAAAAWFVSELAVAVAGVSATVSASSQAARARNRPPSHP